jgi:hypothetical protein
MLGVLFAWEMAYLVTFYSNVVLQDGGTKCIPHARTVIRWIGRANGGVWVSGRGAAHLHVINLAPILVCRAGGEKKGLFFLSFLLRYSDSDPRQGNEPEQVS